MNSSNRQHQLLLAQIELRSAQAALAVGGKRAKQRYDAALAQVRALCAEVAKPTGSATAANVAKAA